jgi:hypothetical protein
MAIARKTPTPIPVFAAVLREDCVSVDTDKGLDLLLFAFVVAEIVGLVAGKLVGPPA